MSIGNPNPPMPPFPFTATYNGISNVLNSEVQVGSAFDVSLGGPPPLTAHKFWALWDTGATHSVITEKVVVACGLRPHGIARCRTADAEVMALKYYVSFVLPNRLCIPSIEVTTLKAQDADVIIGMDVINMGDFAVTNYGGRTTFSFRIPSMKKIDFVDYPKPDSIYELCPCESGKKWKFCHGDRDFNRW